MQTSAADSQNQIATQARAIRAALPPGGLFAGQQWRISPTPFPLGDKLAKEVESLGGYEGAINIPMTQLEKRLGELPRDKTILTA